MSEIKKPQKKKKALDFLTAQFPADFPANRFMVSPNVKHCLVAGFRLLLEVQLQLESRFRQDNRRREALYRRGKAKMSKQAFEIDAQEVSSRLQRHTIQAQKRTSRLINYQSYLGMDSADRKYITSPRAPFIVFKKKHMDVQRPAALINKADLFGLELENMTF